MKKDEEWIAREAKLWHQMMDPKTYASMRDQDGKPVSENKKVARSWAIYKRWQEHV
jgi:hypothetical protein